MDTADTRNDTTGVERDLGAQPIARILDALGLKNHALVAASSEPLTHKMISKARKGRRLSPKLKNRIAEALNQAIATRQSQADAPATHTPSYSSADLFNY
jgi:hypothetical protein